MADSTELSDEEVERIVKAITDKWVGSHACPICQTDSWTMAADALAPMRLKGLAGSVQTGGSVYPNAALMCDNCGYTQFFNLVMLGIVNPPSPKGGGNG